MDFEKGANNTHIKKKGDIERWAKDVYTFVSDRYGEENIAAFVVHLDELNPYVYCTLLSIKGKKFAYKEIFSGKDNPRMGMPGRTACCIGRIAYPASEQDSPILFPTVP